MKMVAAREIGCCEKLRPVFFGQLKAAEKLDLQSENIIDCNQQWNLCLNQLPVRAFPLTRQTLDLPLQYN